jgi:zinc transport system permease protein
MELLTYPFIQRAIIVGIIIAVVCPTIGLFLVLRRLSMIGDSLSHVSLAGVAAGLLFGVYPIAMAVIFSVSAAMIIERLRKTYHRYSEIAIAIVLSGGIGLAVVLISLSKSNNTDLMGYLFGSIVAVTRQDLAAVTVLGLLVILSIILLFRMLFYVAFDEEGAKLAGIPVTIVSTIFTIITAITVSIAMRIVGILLVSSLMVLPVAIALQVGTSFKKTLLISIGISIFSVIFGLITSFILDLAPGGTIVITLVAILVLILTMKPLIQDITIQKQIKRSQHL